MHDGGPIDLTDNLTASKPMTKAPAPAAPITLAQPPVITPLLSAAASQNASLPQLSNTGTLKQTSAQLAPTLPPTHPVVRPADQVLRTGHADPAASKPSMGLGGKERDESQRAQQGLVSKVSSGPANTFKPRETAAAPIAVKQEQNGEVQSSRPPRPQGAASSSTAMPQKVNAVLQQGNTVPQDKLRHQWWKEVQASPLLQPVYGTASEAGSSSEAVRQPTMAAAKENVPVLGGQGAQGKVGEAALTAEIAATRERLKVLSRQLKNGSLDDWPDRKMQVRYLSCISLKTFMPFV